MLGRLTRAPVTWCGLCALAAFAAAMAVLTALGVV
jgi:hypothetical protein